MVKTRLDFGRGHGLQNPAQPILSCPRLQPTLQYECDGCAGWRSGERIPRGEEGRRQREVSSGRGEGGGGLDSSA
jgi:hypothetical protein